MDIVGAANQMSAIDTKSSQGMLMLKKAKDQMETQGANIVEMIKSSEVAINDGKSLNIRV